MNRPEYNDNPLPIDQVLYDRMRKHGEPPAVPAMTFSYFNLRVNQPWMQESMNYFPSTLPTYLFVILSLYFPSSLIKMTVRAPTISRSVHFWPFFFRTSIDVPTSRTSNPPIGRLLDSSRRLQSRPSAGASSSAAWRPR